MCSSQGNVLSFTIDFASGFTCSEGNSKVKEGPWADSQMSINLAYLSKQVVEKQKPILFFFR